MKTNPLNMYELNFWTCTNVWTGLSDCHCPLNWKSWTPTHPQPPKKEPSQKKFNIHVPTLYDIDLSKYIHVLTRVQEIKCVNLNIGYQSGSGTIYIPVHVKVYIIWPKTIQWVSTYKCNEVVISIPINTNYHFSSSNVLFNRKWYHCRVKSACNPSGPT